MFVLKETQHYKTILDEKIKDKFEKKTKKGKKISIIPLNRKLKKKGFFLRKKQKNSFSDNNENNNIDDFDLVNQANEICDNLL